MSGSAGEFGRLLAEARGGSEEAFGHTLEACRAYLLGIAERELDADLRAKGGASDLVQETFLEAHRNFGRFRGDTEGALLAWLRRLLLNNLADFRRRYRETQKRQAAIEVPLGDALSSDLLRNEPAADQPSPGDELIAREQREAGRRALERLPEDYCRVLDLRYGEDLPFEEVGRRMGRSAKAAQKLFMRAVEAWGKEMEGLS